MGLAYATVARIQAHTSCRLARANKKNTKQQNEMFHHQPTSASLSSFPWPINRCAHRSISLDKIVIPEKIAIRLLNSSEVTAEQFYRHILEQYRILNQLQQQRQQFLQKQHMQLQQLVAAGKKFQEIFATATIIQANPNDPLKQPPKIPTNSTFQTLAAPPPPPPVSPIMDTTPAHMKRKSHRKHYNNNNNNNNHHRHNMRKIHKKPLATMTLTDDGVGDSEAAAEQPSPSYVHEVPLNHPPTSGVVVQQLQLYTPMPIPLILNSNEDKRTHYGHAAAARKSADVPSSYMNPFLTGELIFEK